MFLKQKFLKTYFKIRTYFCREIYIPFWLEYYPYGLIKWLFDFMCLMKEP